MSHSANRLREIREGSDPKVELYDIAAHLRISVDAVRRWERPGELIPSKHIEPLATFLGVAPGYLMGWDREPVTEKAA